MKSVSATHRTQHDTLSADLEAAKEALESALRRFDERTRELWAEEVDPCVAHLNTTIEAAEALRDEVAAAMDDHAAEKSDRWLEGEVGQQFQECMLVRLTHQDSWS